MFVCYRTKDVRLSPWNPARGRGQTAQHMLPSDEAGNKTQLPETLPTFVCSSSLKTGLKATTIY